MALFWRRKKSIEAEKTADRLSSVEVTRINKQAHRTTEQANRDIKKLDDLLRANGITLQIHVASGGRHGR